MMAALQQAGSAPMPAAASGDTRRAATAAYANATLAEQERLGLPEDRRQVLSDADAQALVARIDGDPKAAAEAQVFKIFCTAPLSGFFGVMADYTTIVLVKPGQAPSLDDTVLDITANWQTMEQIPWASAIEWKNARQLQIVLPEQVSISRRKATVAGIAAEAKLVPLQTMASQTP